MKNPQCCMHVAEYHAMVADIYRRGKTMKDLLPFYYMDGRIELQGGNYAIDGLQLALKHARLAAREFVRAGGAK